MERAENQEELVLQARTGDADAFCELVRLHQARVNRVTWYLLHNAEDAQDAAQEAFVKAFRSLDSLAEPVRFTAWLMRIVNNTALNLRRSRAIRRAASLDDDGGSEDGGGLRLADALLSTGDREDGDAEARESTQRVSAAIDELPEKQRLALVLFAIEGLPQSEVAEVLGCSTKAVKWHVFEARRKLKESLSELIETSA